MDIMSPSCNWRRHRSHSSRLRHLTVLPLILLMLVTPSHGSASSKSGHKIQLFPLAQHVDSSVAKKLQNILPALSARLWTHLQIVKRDLKQDLRNIRVLLEEHAGVTHPQAVGDSIPSVVQSTTKAPSREEEDTSPVVVAKNQTEEHEKRDEDQQCTVTLDRNITQAVGELKKILEDGLVTVTEACVKEIEENNQAIFDQQRMIIKTLELITKRLPGYNVGSLPLASRTLPFPASNQVIAPRDCWDVLKRNIPAVNNVNVILPLEDSTAKPRRVRCEHRTAGGGWTVVLHRQQQQQQQLSFRRDWREYREGFGDPTGEYWIGLQTLHDLTRDAPYELRVNVAIGEEEAHSVYTQFSVGPSSVSGTGYRLNVSGYRDRESTAGDALSYHNGMAFTTYDTDNDVAKGGSCSLWCGGGGWWYNYCFNANPTGVYPPDSLSRTTEGDVYIEWRTWQGYYAYLTRLTMMIRPQKDRAT